MTTEQYYRLAKSWTGDEWPLPITDEMIGQLNEVSVPGYHYSLCPTQDGHDRVELFEYVGEFNPFEFGEYPDEDGR